MKTPMHLIEFNIENYRSIRELTTLSMIASPLHERKSAFKSKVMSDKLLNCVAIYGPNAGGKSNILRALFNYQHLLLEPGDIFSFKEIPEPFLLDEKSRFKDTVLEATFELNNCLYTYGFSVAVHKKIVTSEWLKFKNADTNRLTQVYSRHGQKLNVNRNMPLSTHGISRSSLNNLSTGELLLPAVAKLSKWSLAKDISDAWRASGIRNTLYHNPMTAVAEYLIDNPESKDDVVTLLQEADIPITDIHITREDESFEVKLEHMYKTERGHKRTSFDLLQQESEGTINLFKFALDLLFSLRDGTLMVLDELGSTLHPDLLRYVVELFANPQHNTHDAQLILTTHDTSLLKKGILARDQIYFAAKDSDQATEVYSLGNIKGIRKNLPDLDDRYLAGDFGAVPEIIGR